MMTEHSEPMIALKSGPCPTCNLPPSLAGKIGHLWRVLPSEAGVADLSAIVFDRPTGQDPWLLLCPAGHSWIVQRQRAPEIV